MHMPPAAAAGGMWFIPDGPERSVVLLPTGILHLAFGIVRGSWLWSLSAIVFGNLALWTFYGKYDEWSFGARPQFWLVPPAVSVLVALHLNRHRITHGQASMARYFCIAVSPLSEQESSFFCDAPGSASADVKRKPGILRGLLGARSIRVCRTQWGQ